MTNIRLFIPPLFSEVKQNLTTEINTYIDGLKIKTEEKKQLKKYYDKVWNLVTSGEIQLECDLHFTDGTKKYIVDFKSGFGSNEKGNTNRLLLVGSIYKNIEVEDYQCLIFVLQKTTTISPLFRILEYGIHLVVLTPIIRYTILPALIFAHG